MNGNESPDPSGNSSAHSSGNPPGAPQATERDSKRFHGWRLLAVIMGIVVLLAVVSFLVDWIVIGPLEGRAF